MKKIWLFNHYAVPPQYYPLARTEYFAKFLDLSGFETKVFSASTAHNSDVNLIKDGRSFREENVDGIDHVYLRSSNYKSNGLDRIINMLQYTWGLFRNHSKFEKPDLIFASSVHPLTCYAGIRIARKYKIPCVIEIADLWPETLVEFGFLKRRSFIAQALYKLEKYLYRHADAIVFTMEGGAQYITEMKWDQANGGPVDLEKVFHINNGIDLALYHENREKYIVEDEDLNNRELFKVVYTGSLGFANEVGGLITVAEHLQDHKDIKLLVWGDGDHRKGLEKEAESKKLNNIAFKGKVDKKYIPHILSQSDVNIFFIKNNPLYRFGLSLNKLFDYLASGKPIISNYKEGYSILEKNHCGFYADHSSEESFVYESMANRIVELKEMQKTDYLSYQSICDNSKRTAQEYDFSVLTDKLISVFERVGVK